MSGRLRLTVIFLAAIAIAGIGSHLIVRWLGIRTGGIGYNLLANSKGGPLALAEGSSLMLDSLLWQKVSEELGAGIQNWFVAGSSPSEWEPLQRRAPDAKLTFIAVSVYDLNENFLCDYRSEIVPFDQAVKDLRESRADWTFSKRVLSQYPIKYLRVIFPTVGRSDGVMVGLREKIRQLLRPWVKMDSESGPTVVSKTDSTVENAQTGKVSDWPRSRVLRRVALMRSACQGKHTFDGPKKLAFGRMLRQARQQGRVVVVVLPMSPIYQGEFVTTEVSEQFEAALLDVQRSVPGARWVHLDQLPALHSDDYFWDLVHLNAGGQRIATEAFLSELHSLPSVN